MKIKAIIVDDEKSGRETLEWLLKENCPDVDIIAKASNADDGYNMCIEKKPQLIFLDIHMPGGGGFEFLKKFSLIPFEVIFVTAYDKYAINAFKYSAVDYLLKPVKVAELKDAVAKARNLCEFKTVNLRVAHLLQSLQPKESPDQQKIIVPIQSGYEVLTIANIVRLESEANYTRFYLSGGKDLLASKTMKEFESLLAQNGFYRVHRSHLINLRHVSKYLKSEGGIVVMDDGSQIEIARDRKDDFLKTLGAF